MNKTSFAGDGAAFEAFGSVVILMLLIMTRHPEYQVALANSGSLAYIFRSLGQKLPLQQLSLDQRNLVQRWIGALFSDGIADELIS